MLCLNRTIVGLKDDHRLVYRTILGLKEVMVTRWPRIELL